MKRRVAVLVTLALALGLHALLAWLELAPAPRRLWGDEIMYAELAERAARGEPAAPELLWPPLYPRLLGLAARLGPLAEGPVPVARRPARGTARCRSRRRAGSDVPGTSADPCGSTAACWWPDPRT